MKKNNLVEIITYVQNYKLRKNKILRIISREKKVNNNHIKWGRMRR